MLYAILCYDSEDVVGSWTKEQDATVMAKLAAVAGEARRAAGSARSRGSCRPPRRRRCARAREPLVLDGPFAETKEQLLGFYIVECASLEEALETARELGARASAAAPTRSARCGCSVRGGARPT